MIRKQNSSSNPIDFPKSAKNFMKKPYTKRPLSRLPLLNFAPKFLTE